MLHGLILIVHLFVCFVLIAVILLQAGRGGGLADTFGSGAAQSLFGTRGTAFLTRATTACAVIFMSTSLLLAVLSAQRGRSLIPARVPAQDARRTPAVEPTQGAPTKPPPATETQPNEKP